MCALLMTFAINDFHLVSSEQCMYGQQATTGLLAFVLSLSTHADIYQHWPAKSADGRL